MAITLACKVRDPGSKPGLYKILICETRFAKIPIMKRLPEICFKKRVFVACLLLLFNPQSIRMLERKDLMCLEI